MTVSVYELQRDNGRARDERLQAAEDARKTELTAYIEANRDGFITTLEEEIHLTNLEGLFVASVSKTVMPGEQEFLAITMDDVATHFTAPGMRVQRFSKDDGVRAGIIKGDRHALFTDLPPTECTEGVMVSWAPVVERPPKRKTPWGKLIFRKKS